MKAEYVCFCGSKYTAHRVVGAVFCRWCGREMLPLFDVPPSEKEQRVNFEDTEVIEKKQETWRDRPPLL